MKFNVHTKKATYPAGYATVPVVGEQARPALDKMVRPITRSR